jgi:hypothetical protein
MVMGGNPVAAKKFNPNLIAIQYTTSFITYSERSGHKDNNHDTYWSELHKYVVERHLNEEEFYLHTAEPIPGCDVPAKTNACRLITPNAMYNENNYNNVGNPEFVKFSAWRLNLLAKTDPGFDGWFFDTNDAVMLHNVVCGNRPFTLNGKQAHVNSLEYGTSCTKFYSDFNDFMKAMATGFKGPLVPNVNLGSGDPNPTLAAQKDKESKQIAQILGWVFPEGQNNIFQKYTDLWPVIDDYQHSGIKMLMSFHAYANENQFYSDFGDVKGNFSPGSYDTILHRYGMTVLTQHYLLQPSGPKLGDYYFAPQAEPWDIDFNLMYPQAAAKADVGVPTGPRTQFDPATGQPTNATQTDPKKQLSTFWRREFTKAWIIERPRSAYSANAYGNDTAMVVKLPPGNLVRLNWDGTTTPVSGSIMLHNVEGAILLKKLNGAATLLRSDLERHTRVLFLARES